MEIQKKSTMTKKSKALTTKTVSLFEPKIYSPKLDKYVPLNLGNPKGEIQEHNIGLGPGSWY